MKTIFYLTLGMVMLLITATCSSTTENGLEVTGTIREQGITSYQYGTHTISNQDHLFAIKSDRIDLDQYIDQEVTIKAEKIEGYPVDGGPEFLLVLEVK